MLYPFNALLFTKNLLLLFCHNCFVGIIFKEC